MVVTALEENNLTAALHSMLKEGGPTEKNDLLEFLWFGKSSCTCSQLLEELCREILKVFLQRTVAGSLPPLQG